MTTFLALYRGSTVVEAKIVCLSADLELVAHIAEELLANGSTDDLPCSDAVLTAPPAGYVSALSLMADLCPQNGGVDQ